MWYTPENTVDGDTLQFVVEPEVNFNCDFNTTTPRTGVEFVGVQFSDLSTPMTVGARIVLNGSTTTVDDSFQFII